MGNSELKTSPGDSALLCLLSSDDGDNGVLVCFHFLIVNFERLLRLEGVIKFGVASPSLVGPSLSSLVNNGIHVSSW